MIVNSPIIELNRAVAIGMAEGGGEALAIIDGLAQKPDIRLPTCYRAFGAIYFTGSAASGKRAALEQGAALANNKREHDLLARREAARAAMSSTVRTEPAYVAGFGSEVPPMFANNQSGLWRRFQSLGLKL